jgi:hypothetical protein
MKINLDIKKNLKDSLVFYPKKKEKTRGRIRKKPTRTIPYVHHQHASIHREDLGEPLLTPL